jgi:hypothetical protein
MHLPSWFLIAGLLAQAPNESQRRLLTLEARFLCADLRPIPLDVIEGVGADLVIPAGCPGQGENLSVQLSCARQACWGVIIFRKRVAGSVEENGTSLTVTTQGPVTDRGTGPSNNPASMLALAILRSSRVDVSQPTEGRPIRLSLSMDGPTPATAMLAVPPGTSSRISIQAEVIDVEFDWEGANQVAIRLRGPGGTAWQRTLPVDSTLAVGCRELGLHCATQVALRVQPFRR